MKSLLIERIYNKIKYFFFRKKTEKIFKKIKFCGMDLKRLNNTFEFYFFIFHYYQQEKFQHRLTEMIADALYEEMTYISDKTQILTNNETNT